MYSIKTASEKSGVSVQTLYKQIEEERALGRYFKKNSLDKYVIEEKYIDELTDVK